LLFCVILTLSAGLRAADYATRSVLAEGKWVQLKITETAVYKLTYDEIKNMGFSDPAKIKLYGYGGWILDQDFTKTVIDDLPEVAVYLHKGADGVFNSGDYLLFYGRGLVKWTYQSSSDLFSHTNNPYSLYTSYFITENAAGPKELPLQESQSATNQSVTTFDDYCLHEKDEVSLLKSGRELFGENFILQPSRNFTFSIPGITNDAGKVRLSFAAMHRLTTPTPVTLSINGENLITLKISRVTTEYQKANLGEDTKDWTANKSENVTVNVNYSSTGASLAYLNFIELNMKRQLKFYNTAYTFFRNKAALSQSLEYVIDNVSANCMVWNVSDVENIRKVDVTVSGSQMKFGAAAGTLAEYVMVDISKSFPTPQVIGSVANQDLHGLPQTDMVIIAPDTYLPYAAQLAEKHREKQGLHVTVVQPEWIYNEFSSGTPDITAYRRFMKMFYDRANTIGHKPKYLLLYGDGHYNNRNINPHFQLLSYQYPNSVNESSSFGTDDYVGFLDNNEGVNLERDVLDIGVGRFPVNSALQAENVMKKVVGYMDNQRLSAWKNTVIFTADDTGDDAFCTYGGNANDLAKYVETNHPQYMVVKSYMDAHQAITVNGKKTYPTAKDKLFKTLKDGCFLFNYTGHGSPSSMSAEDMMHISDIRQMSFENLPLWITATCDFGRYDTDENSAGEEVFLNKKSAGIALFTTTRVVYSNGNQSINRLLVKYIFEKNSEGQHHTLGDIIRLSKAEMGADNGNKLNFILIGDPALQLNYPEWNVALKSINGIPTGNDTVNFRALEQVSLEGAIEDANGNLLTDFNGTLNAKIFDGRQLNLSVTTKPYDSDNPYELINNPDYVLDDNNLIHWTFYDYPNVVYQGQETVENGQFSMSFIVPIDISYTKNEAIMNFYASDKSTFRDAAGMYSKYTISGTAEYPDANEQGPDIERMYLNSTSFKNGDKVNETPLFFAEVYDKDGINQAGSGIGHDLMISIDGKQLASLNNYYQAGSEFGRGTVAFSIPELSEGKHELTFRVWDNLNNSSTASLTFTVVKGYQPEIYNLTASNNPAKTSTNFVFTHNRPETTMTVEVRVFDLTGRMMWSQTETGSSDFMQSYSVEWNLTNAYGQKVKPGVYLYQAVIQTNNGKEISKSKKLIVL